MLFGFHYLCWKVICNLLSLCIQCILISLAFWLIALKKETVICDVPTCDFLSVHSFGDYWSWIFWFGIQNEKFWPLLFEIIVCFHFQCSNYMHVRLFDIIPQTLVTLFSYFTHFFSICISVYIFDLFYFHSFFSLLFLPCPFKEFFISFV